MRNRRRLAALLVLLAALPVLAGCVRVEADLVVSADDLVSGRILAAALAPDGAQDPSLDGPEGTPLLVNDLPFGHKVAVTPYEEDGFVGSEAVFSDLTFAEVPQLARMNADAAGVDVSLRRTGNNVILEGRVDLTSLTDREGQVSMSVSFPGEVTSTNGERVDDDTVEWILQPGVVTTMAAQAQYTDPSTRSFTGAALWLGIGALLVAAVIGGLAYQARDRTPRPGRPYEAPGV